MGFVLISCVLYVYVWMVLLTLCLNILKSKKKTVGLHVHTHKHTNVCAHTNIDVHKKTGVCLCLCVWGLSLSLWAGTGPKRVLARLMGFHTLKYTHVHTFGHTIMLKINMSESYVWSQTNKHTHPHMHTLWYKRICQAPTLYTCKTNGLQKSTQPSLLLSHFQNTRLHTPANMQLHHRHTFPV